MCNFLLNLSFKLELCPESMILMITEDSTMRTNSLPVSSTDDIEWLFVDFTHVCVLTWFLLWLSVEWRWAFGRDKQLILLLEDWCDEFLGWIVVCKWFLAFTVHTMYILRPHSIQLPEILGKHLNFLLLNLLITKLTINKFLFLLYRLLQTLRTNIMFTTGHNSRWVPNTKLFQTLWTFLLLTHIYTILICNCVI